MDSLNLRAEGYQTTSWTFRANNIDPAYSFTRSDRLTVPNLPGASVEVRCFNDGCPSESVKRFVGNAAVVNLVAASKQEAFPGDSIDISVALEGTFEEQNTLSSLLTIGGQTYNLTSNIKSNEFKIRIPSNINSNGKATLNIKPSAPETISKDYEIEILPKPGLEILSNDKLCKNSELQLLVISPDSSVSFTWYVDSTQTISAEKSYTINQPSTYNITVLNSIGCTNTDSKLIDYYAISPNVEILDKSVLCKDSTLTLPANGSGANPFTYEWTKDD